jgi:hypothetical protein
MIEYENDIAREALKGYLKADFSPMDPAVKVKWLDDLATAKQAKSSLKNEDTGGYCCLGRLCVVAGGQFGVIVEEHVEEHDPDCIEENCGGCYMPMLVVRPMWPDGTLMSHDNEDIDWGHMVGLSDDARGVLIDLNDKSDSFKYVMEFIREKL